MDTRIRELTHGTRSLDDFARSFFGEGAPSSKNPSTLNPVTPVTYTFEDVVKGLNTVAPFDWASFFHTRLTTKGPGAPLEGIARGGWKIVYRDSPSGYSQKLEDLQGTADFSYSLGLSVGKENRIVDVVWEGPAFKSGLGTSMTVMAVNGTEYKADVLRDAIRSAQTDHTAISLLVKDQDQFRTVSIDYAGGLRYPDLERVEGTEDRLSEILKPRT